MKIMYQRDYPWYWQTILNNSSGQARSMPPSLLRLLTMGFAITVPKVNGSFSAMVSEFFSDVVFKYL
jgi:hypothetical protein